MIFDTHVSPRSVFSLSLGGVNATSTKSYVPVNRLHPIKNTQWIRRMVSIMKV